MNSLRATAVTSILLAVAGLLALPAAIADDPVQWVLPAPNGFALGLRLDLLAAVLLVFVAGLVAIVAAYSRRNLRGQARTTRFGLLLLGSLAASTLFVAGASLPVMAVGWTLTGWSLAALVNHRGTAQARRAARYVLRTLTLSDVLVWAAVLAAAVLLPSLDRADMSAVAAAAGPESVVVALLLVLAAAVRSAAPPWWRWLPATAEAPSPVSAYLHAGVVNGGGMLIALTWPLLAAAPAALAALIVIGLASVVAGTAAMRLRPDVKGQLAASTTAQMGYMGLQFGLGLPAVAVLHLVGHGCYKAWQFLRAGGEVTRRREAMVPVDPGAGRKWMAAGAAAAVVGAGVLVASPALVGLIADLGPTVLVPLATAAIAAAVAAAAVPTARRATPASTVAVAAAAAVALGGYYWVVAMWEGALAPVFPVEAVWPQAIGWFWVGVAAAAGVATALTVRSVLRCPDGRIALSLLPSTLPPVPRGPRQAAPGFPVPTPQRDEVEVRELCSAAAHVVAPTFPLRTFVASNPLAGLEQWEFGDAAEIAQRTWNAQSHLREGEYLRLYRSGRITAADLSAAGVDDTAGFLAGAPDAVTVVPDGPAPADLRQSVGSAWTAHVWAGPGDGRDLFGRWLDACRSDSFCRRMGVPGAAQLATVLPRDSHAAIGHMLGLIASEVPAVGYLAALLTDQPGWAAHAAWRGHQGDDDATADLMALRMMVDLAADGESAIAARAQQEALALDLTRRETWQRALEAGFRHNLVDGLAERVRSETPPAARSVTAQLVFCIDVRSERLRRHLESVGDYDTYGYAGFFGAAVRYESATGQTFDQCPVLISPTSALSDDSRPATRRYAAAGAVAATKAPLAPMALAEASGPLLGVAAAVQTVAPGLLARRGSGAGSAAAVRGLHGTAGPHGSVDDRVDLARSALSAIGLTEGFAPLIVIVGHGATVANNAFAAGYDCGACGGNAGIVNARLLADALNDPDVRAVLAEGGIRLTEGTRAVAALHDTTTDRVEIDGAEPIAATGLEQLRADLDRAGGLAAAERSAALPGAPTRGRADLRRVRRHLAARSHDWAEPAPEWGLAGNAAFIAGPRWLTESLNLQGRVFLHSYDPAADSELQVLHTIVNAPVVVAQWINSQYYFATVDPVRFGAGDKSTHNVVGDFGVMTGAAGDLRLGLPWQAVADREDRAGTAESVHEPLRLAVVLYANPDDIDTVLVDSPHVARLIGNGWITLAAVVPGSGDTFEMDRRLTWLRRDRESGAVEPAGATV